MFEFKFRSGSSLNYSIFWNVSDLDKFKQLNLDTEQLDLLVILVQNLYGIYKNNYKQPNSNTENQVGVCSYKISAEKSKNHITIRTFGHLILDIRQLR